MITQDQLPMVAMPTMNDTHLEEMLIINKLDEAARQNDMVQTKETLEELIEHTTAHFANEEAMMQKAHFPAYEMHKSEHNRHLTELQSILKYFNEHQDTRAVHSYIEGNLSQWLIHHIQTMDTMTAMFLQEGSHQ